MQAAAPATTPVHSMKRGQCGVVEDIAGSSEFVCRIGSMGIAPGCLLECLEPGSPCCLAVGDCRIVLRGEQASAVRVCLLS